MKFTLTILLMVLCALLIAALLPAVIRYWKGVWRNLKPQTSLLRQKHFGGRANFKRITRRKLALQRRLLLATLFAPFAWAFMRLALWHQRVFGGDPSRIGPMALANTLGPINEHGIESLIIDPASVFPLAKRYLIYERGAAAQYALLAQGVNVPLGPSSDSPYLAGDIVNIRRLGIRPGLELGIPSGAITIDHLVYAAAAGKVADITLAGNGDVWVVGRAAQTVAATDIEVAYAPVVPYKITVSNGGGTYAFTGAGV